MRAIFLAIALTALIAAPTMGCETTDNGGRTDVPAYGAQIDKLLPESQLSRADLDKVMTLRAQIKDALAAGQRRAAYEAETQAMSILGYKRIATRCGPGESSWRKIDKEEGGTLAEASPIS